MPLEMSGDFKRRKGHNLVALADFVPADKRDAAIRALAHFGHVLL